MVETLRLYTHRVTKGNAETTGDLMKLSGQRRCKFSCTSEAQTHQGKKAKSEHGRDLQNVKGSVPRRDARTWRGGTVQKPCRDAPRRSAGREGGTLGEGKLRGAEQRRTAGPRLTQVGGVGQGKPVRGPGPEEAGEVRRRGHLGRAGRRRPGSPRALAGAEGEGRGAAPSLPASPAAGRAGPGRLSPVSRLKEMRASAR